jgi:hypothetical protein
MLNFNLFENIDLNFFCLGANEKSKTKKKKKDENLELLNELKISILPLIPAFDLDNLYHTKQPPELWNTFIVGNDKTYILANITDPFISVPNSEILINKQGHNILPLELMKVFDDIWNKTLQNKQLQFFLVWNTRLYFTNTYPFLNAKGKVIGACLFMRLFDNIDSSKINTITTINNLPIRVSKEFANYEETHASDIAISNHSSENCQRETPSKESPKTSENNGYHNKTYLEEDHCSTIDENKTYPKQKYRSRSNEEHKYTNKQDDIFKVKHIIKTAKHNSFIAKEIFVQNNNKTSPIFTKI